ncbi:MAG: hypothetical protein R3223_07080, partial [Longimicrobiales bacterium]|nr:hypothetical protein [Longimicrobiales bacterium]
MRSLSRTVVRCFSIPLVVALIGCGGTDTSGSPGGSQSADVTAFVGARIVDGTGAAPIDQGVLVVRDGRIAAVGPSSEIDVPAGAQEVDLSGRTVVPGIINAHGHVGSARGLETGPEVYTRENILDQLGVNARYGVTTVVSLGGDGPEGIRVRDEQNQPGLDRARLFVAGPVLNPDTPEEAVEQVVEVAEMGVDW